MTCGKKCGSYVIGGIVLFELLIFAQMMLRVHFLNPIVTLYTVHLSGLVLKELHFKDKVNYNNIMRRLMQVPPFSSVSFLFGSLGVKTVQELIRTNQYSLIRRIESSANSLIVLLNSSEAILRCSIRQHWRNSLFI